MITTRKAQTWRTLACGGGTVTQPTYFRDKQIVKSTERKAARRGGPCGKGLEERRSTGAEGWAPVSFTYLTLRLKSFVVWVWVIIIGGRSSSVVVSWE